MTPELTRELSARKADILAYLKRAQVSTKSGEDGIDRVPRDGVLPLSFGQQRLWFLDRFEGPAATYNMPLAVQLNGTLNVAALEQALVEITRRHEVLRTNFTMVSEQPATRIREAAECPLVIESLVDRTDAHEEGEIVQRRVEEAARRCFDLAEDHLLHATLVRLGDTSHLFLVTMHHIVSDGWSLGVLIRELTTLYAAFHQGLPSPLPELPIQYVDYAHWQRERLRGEMLQTQLDYWRTQLADAPEVLNLPTDRPRPPIQTHRGRSLGCVIDTQLTADLRELSRTAGTTLFMTLLSGFAILLSRYCDEEDMVIGTAVANRNHPDIESLIGLFINTLVLRVNLFGDPSVEDVLMRVRQTCLQAYAHQEIPFEQLVEELKPTRNLSHSPLFQVTFDLQHTPMAEVEMPGLSLSSVEQDAVASKFDLSFSMEETGSELSAVLLYNPDLFDDASIARMLSHYRMLLAGMVADPRQVCSRLPLLEERERRQILYDANETVAPYPREQTFLQRFESWVDQTPDRIAISFNGETLTYGQLNRRSNQLAYHLQTLGVGPERLVALCVDRSLEMVVGLLGIMKSGGAYIPLDSAYPRERQARVLDDACPTVLLTQEYILATLPETDANVVCLDRDWEDVIASNEGRVRLLATPEHAAYVIYTSGSTGRPKGVQVTHRALMNFLVSMQREPGLTARDVLLAVTTISFDIAALELYLPLIVGAHLVLADRDTALDGRRLQALLRNTEATVMQATPAMWRLMIETGWRPDASLSMICGGEALPVDLAAQLLQKNARLWNLYGPTETTIWSAVRRVEGLEGEARTQEGVEPIGHPINNTQIYVLDRQLQPLPVGVPGEIYIGGDGLARGYLNRAQLTAESYVPDPFSGASGARLYRTGDLARRLPNGNIEFLGRIDYQVKLRGYRIELGEIETALRQHAAIREAVVLVRDDTPGDQRLIAYMVSSGEQSPETDALRVHLKDVLPAFMIPAAFVCLDAMPLTPNGKVNRKALPAPDQSRPALTASYLEPRSQMEQLVAEIWREALGIDDVGIDDNFFDLGGHSLLMTQVHETLRKRIARSFSLVELFQYPTIRTLAAWLSQAEETDVTPVRIRSGAGNSDAIALIGVAGRFPDADDLRTFWDNLRDGRESISFFSDDELLASGVEPDLIANPNYVKANGILSDIAGFDAVFFGFSPTEAEVMDPQHRLFLESAWHVLENAGYGGSHGDASIGVFAGCSHNRYLITNLLPHLYSRDSHSIYQVLMGNDKDFLPTRVSYALDLKGPSISVQTACSTSLVAVHLACKSLLNGECDMALAGGVGFKIPQKSGYLYQEGMITSPDGHCRAFDANARGTTWGSGLGIVLLKPLEAALADGDSIYAVIKGSAVNNDGSLKVGFTAPGIEGQAEVIANAQARAGVEPDSISYIETHGTGTPIGDPIEIAALTRAFRTATDKTQFCALGSVKTNIGHLDTAAGIAGLIKTVLALQHRQIPPSLHFEQPNAEIDFETSPFYVNNRLSDWPANGQPRRAGVSSFGIGGTNIHLILEEAPEREPSDASRPWQILTLSAQSETAVETMRANLAAYLRENPGINLPDAAYTLGIGRRSFHHRMAVVCHDPQDAIRALQAPERLRCSGVEGEDREIIFMFPGQGAQYARMGASLYRTEPVFREQIDLCAKLLQDDLSLDLRQAMYPPPEEAETASARLAQTWLTQPSLFATEYALARLWMSWGVAPRAMIGHSLGEYVAACLAGVFDLETALKLVARRGRLMWEQPSGSMLAVSLAAQDIQPLLGDTVSVAAVNSPELCVLSGPSGAIDDLAGQLTADGVVCRPLRTSHAFHSAMMEPVMDAFSDILKRISLQSPERPFVSNLTGTWIRPDEAVNPDYWVRHLREPVRFEAGLRTVLQDSNRVLLEVGPGTTLSTFARRHPLSHGGQPVLASLRRPESGSQKARHEEEARALIDTLGRLWTAGVEVDWPRYYGAERRYRIALPGYPFERERYWVEGLDMAAFTNTGNLLQKKQSLDGWFYLPAWKPSLMPRSLRAEDFANVAGLWLIFSDESELSRQTIARLEQEGQEVITVSMGEHYEQVGSQAFQIRPGVPEDYASLFEAIGHRPIHKMLHFWSLATPDLSGLDAFEHVQDCGYYSLVFLGRAMTQQSHFSGITLAVIANHLHDVNGFGDICPEKATLLGPCLVMPQEVPELICRCLDMVPSPERVGGEAALVNRLLAELEAGPADPLVAYRGGRRLIPSFEPVGLEPEGDAVRDIRHRGVYLITGGLGNVGLHLATFLAETAQARLVLLGRSFFPERAAWETWLQSHPEHDDISRKIRRLIALEAMGAEVLLVRADVADIESMQAVLDQVDTQFGALHAVIHAAGMLQDPSFVTTFDQVGRQESQAQFTPKVYGLYGLAQVLQARELDFCLLISSNAAILGGLGFTAYSAANCFMDAFVCRQNQIGGTPWLSTNWDTWLFDIEVEASVVDDFSMTPQESAAAFQRVVSQVWEGRMIIATGDLPARFDQWVRRQGWLEPAAGGTSIASHARPDLDTAYIAPTTEAESRLATLWQALLGFENVGVHDDFFDLGGDSLSAIRLMTMIKESFGKQLPLDLLLSKSTIHQLVDVLGQPEETFDFSPLVAIHAKGSLPPFFCVPGTGGNVIYFNELARSLGAYDRPFYGLQAHGLDGRTQPLTRIEDIAAHNIQALQDVQPQGPYYLGGHSFGSWVAFEMARQLQQDGHYVPVVAILDTAAPMERDLSAMGGWDDTRWLVAIAEMLAHLYDKSVSLTYESLAHLAWPAQIDALTQHMVTLGIVQPGTDASAIRGLVEVYKTQAQIRYQPATEPRVNLILFRAQEPMADFLEGIPESFVNDAFWGWGAYSAEHPRVEYVPGDHLTMMTQPHVNVAHRLSMYLTSKMPQQP